MIGAHLCSGVWLLFVCLLLSFRFVLFAALSGYGEADNHNIEITNILLEFFMVGWRGWRSNFFSFCVSPSRLRKNGNTTYNKYKNFSEMSAIMWQSWRKAEL